MAFNRVNKKNLEFVLFFFTALETSDSKCKSSKLSKINIYKMQHFPLESKYCSASELFLEVWAFGVFHVKIIIYLVLSSCIVLILGVYHMFGVFLTAVTKGFSHCEINYFWKWLPVQLITPKASLGSLWTCFSGGNALNLYFTYH